MGLDVDYVFAKAALDEIDDILGRVPHGERCKIADEIIEFANHCKKHYSEKSSK